MKLRIGTAGWTLPRQHLNLLPTAELEPSRSHLERYATALPCVEINSSFHRSHRRSTWERWVSLTPENFRFAVKLPKSITHIAKLANAGALLQTFFQEVSALGAKLGPVLVQLPPKLAFDEGVAHEFLTTLRELHRGPVALEPRNATWFTAPANRLLNDFDVARVAADPPKGSDLAGTPGGWPELHYWRLHGSPRTYYSEYDESSQQDLLERITEASRQARETWVIFDNTALGHAFANAVHLDVFFRKRNAEAISEST